MAPNFAKRIQVLTNSFSVCDGEMQGIGVGVYPSAALVNHSCRPNTVAVFDGRELRLRAVQSISSGEEV